MKHGTQISAEVSRETKDLLDKVARDSGLKKGRLIEDALRQYLLALIAVPAEFHVPARVTLTVEEAERVRGLFEHPAPDTAAMRESKRRRKKRHGDSAASAR